MGLPAPLSHSAPSQRPCQKVSSTAISRDFFFLWPHFWWKLVSFPEQKPQAIATLLSQLITVTPPQTTSFPITVSLPGVMKGMEPCTGPWGGAQGDPVARGQGASREKAAVKMQGGDGTQQGWARRGSQAHDGAPGICLHLGQAQTSLLFHQQPEQSSHLPAHAINPHTRNSLSEGDNLGFCDLTEPAGQQTERPAP